MQYVYKAFRALMLPRVDAFPLYVQCSWKLRACAFCNDMHAQMQMSTLAAPNCLSKSAPVSCAIQQESDRFDAVQ